MVIGANTTVDDEVDAVLSGLSVRDSSGEMRDRSTAAAAMKTLVAQGAAFEPAHLQRIAQIIDLSRNLHYFISVNSAFLAHKVDERRALREAERQKLVEEQRRLEKKLTAAQEKVRKSEEHRVELLLHYADWKRQKAMGTCTASFSQHVERRSKRDCGVQNDVKMEMLALQVRKMVLQSMREQKFAEHVQSVRTLVNNMKGIVTRLDRELYCRVCMDIFKRPTTLWPCGHTFCFKCIEASAAVGTGIYQCPSCSMLSTETPLRHVTLGELVGRAHFRSSGFTDMEESAKRFEKAVMMFSKSQVRTMLSSLATHLDKK